jgi:hypothetical protein
MIPCLLTCVDVAYICQRCQHIRTSCTLWRTWQGRSVALRTVPAPLPGCPGPAQGMRRAGPGPPGASGRIGRITEAATAMKTALPPWQLTTSELAREINALEASSAGRPPDADEDGRLGALYEERGERNRLAARLAQTAGQQSPDDEPW